ncbi:unnamed protein product [Mytilus coruscus]|uniref:Uncharacterized protein n=1 Tax=Mytilus coruscus TaxID=42192 RepID=A0A6J8AF24_MYTCO|nr:unnamed protein product [Mytilus coruscus]
MKHMAVNKILNQTVSTQGTEKLIADKATESYLAQLELKINVDNQNIDDGGIRHSAAEKPITETIPLTKENSDNFSVDEHERSDSSGLENPFCIVSSCIDLNSNDVKMDSNICSEEKISSLGLEDMDLMEMCIDSEYTADQETLQLFTENQNPDFLTEEDFQSSST